MPSTPYLELPLMAAMQAQKHVSHNEAIVTLDHLVHLSVLSATLTEPPGQPAANARYIVAAGASGAWVGRDDQVAVWDDGAWRFHQPRAGWLACVGPAAILFRHDGTRWAAVVGPELQNLTRLGVGASADALNPVAVRAPTALFTAVPPSDGGSGHMRIMLNRSGAGATAACQFQTGFSTRAEIGLGGADTFALRTSSNGTTFVDAMVVDPALGIATFPTRPAFRARRASGDIVVSTAGTVVPFNDAPLNQAGGFEVGPSRFRAPVAGVYVFHCSVFATNIAGRCIVDFVKNGSTAISRAELATVSADNDHLNGVATEAMAAGDTVELRLVLGSVRITSGHFTHFSGFLAG